MVHCFHQWGLTHISYTCEGRLASIIHIKYGSMLMTFLFCGYWYNDVVIVTVKKANLGTQPFWTFEVYIYIKLVGTIPFAIIFTVTRVPLLACLVSCPLDVEVRRQLFVNQGITMSSIIVHSIYSITSYNYWNVFNSKHSIFLHIYFKFALWYIGYKYVVMIFKLCDNMKIKFDKCKKMFCLLQLIHFKNLMRWTLDN